VKRKVNAGWFRQQIISRYKLVVGLLLLAILLQCVLSMRLKTVTFDEPRHVLSGYSYLKKGDFSLNWENPPLINVISAAPLLFLQPEIPAHFQEKYSFIHEFLYEINDNADQIIFWARIPIVLLSLLLGFFVFKWASELYGIEAGLFSSLIYAFSPNMLAHSRLATTDLGLSCFIFLACYRLWKFGLRPSARNLLLAGLTLGLALISKFTAVFLLPMYLGFPFVQLFLKERTDESSTGTEPYPPADLLKRGSTLIAYSVLMISIGFLAIGAAYPFSLQTPGKEYVKGLQWSLGHSEKGHDAFLWGQISQKGWWYYHLVALAIKTPIALQIMLLLAIYVSLSRRMKKANLYHDFFIVLPPLLLLAAISVGSVKIGLRHVLPVFPFIFVFIGRFFEPRLERRLFPVAAFCLTVWYLLSSVNIYPHYLAYFNEYVGGPANGYKYLVDSNLDWGQDLKGLKRYMESRNIGKVKLSYFGIADPQYHGVSYEPISDQDLSALEEGRFTRGVFAVSATFLQGLYLPHERDRYQWFRNQPPTAQIGYSIFVYEVDCRKERMTEGATQKPIFSPPPIQYPLKATLGNQVQFLGYDLDTVSIRPGQTLHLTLYWQTLAEMEESYTVFTHMLDKENRMWGQKDSMPVRGTLPTCCWVKDEIIADEYEILVQPDAPPGQYVIEIGMYQLETGQRLEVHGRAEGGDRILLDTVEVSD
jgi:hypothetical protein